MWTLPAIVALALVSLGHCSTPFTDGKPVPKTIILDLDHTTWNAYLDTDYVKQGGTLPLKANEQQPFTHVSNGKVKDKRHTWDYSTDLGHIITAAKKHNIKLAVASKSPNGKDLYSAFLKSIPAPAGVSCAGSNIYGCFDIVIIQDGDKVASLTSIAKSTGAKPEQMILYDDDTRNGKAATTAGVFMHLVGTGGKGNEQLITVAMVEKGIEEWRSKEGGAATRGNQAKIARRGGPSARLARRELEQI